MPDETPKPPGSDVPKKQASRERRRYVPKQEWSMFEWIVAAAAELRFKITAIVGLAVVIWIAVRKQVGSADGGELVAREIGMFLLCVLSALICYGRICRLLPQSARKELAAAPAPPAPPPRSPSTWTRVASFVAFVVIAAVAAYFVPRKQSPAPFEAVADCAKRLNLPPTKTIDLGEGVKMDLVLVPPGRFTMGAPEAGDTAVERIMVGVAGGILLIEVLVALFRAKRPQVSLAYMMAMTIVASFALWGFVRWHEALASNRLDWQDYPVEHPAHEVTLTTPLYMGKFPVTQEQYQRITGKNPSAFKGNDNPVDSVQFSEAEEFCKSLNAKLNLATRLPTEAEWEHACRAGTTTKYGPGDGEADLMRVAWYLGNGGGSTHPVGQKEPNKIGLYDMHGNVLQWCQDGSADYSASAVTDPLDLGHPDGARVLRGGSWSEDARNCRATFRHGCLPEYRYNNFGFRVVEPVLAAP